MGRRKRVAPTMKRYPNTSLGISEGSGCVEGVQKGRQENNVDGALLHWLAPPEMKRLRSWFDIEHHHIQDDIFPGQRMIEVDHSRIIRQRHDGKRPAFSSRGHISSGNGLR